MKINTDLVKLITSHIFLRESYFFIFISRATTATKFYIKKEKNE